MSSQPPSSEPRNPLYFLLLAVGLVFVMTALAYALIPVLEQKAAEAGNPAPPSEWREALRRDGWRWLLYQVPILILVALASMAWDYLRGLQKPSPGAKIPPEKPPES
jgi:uncharacterized protein YjeT (DUF2065 family)